MDRKVIDVSYHNGTINWEKVKNDRVDGAIIRCGYGDNIVSQDDKKWKRNADECSRLKIPFGAYLYSYAKTAAEAKSEAAHVLRLVKEYKLSYPVFLDLEEPGTQSGAIERAKIFGDLIENAGYWCGVYASKSWWDNYLKGLTRFTRWVARYNSTLGMEADMWQYTSGGSVSGISGLVDLNHCYRDYPAEITGSSKTERAVSIQLYTPNASDAQKWKLEKQADNVFMLKNVASELYLDVKNGTAKSKTPVRVYTGNQTAAQKWRIDQASETSIDKPSVIESVLDDKLVLDAKDGGKTNGTGIQIYTANGTTAQLWNFVYAGSRWTYYIINAVSGKALDVVNGGR